MKFGLSFSFAFLAIGLSNVLAAPIASSEIAVKASQGLRLLSLAQGAEPEWKTEDEKLELMRAHVGFIDVTETYETEQALPKSKAAAYVYANPKYQTAVKALIANLSTTQMNTYLSTLTAYNNRYYKSSTGAEASNWILSTVKSLAAARTDVTVTAFTHSWGQNSVIASFAGSTASTPLTILGAHLDSINLNSPTSGRAPGADDDGSGTVNLIDVFRVLIAGGFKPATPVEFHWYSGEEGGLLGSNAIATSYKNAGKAVKAFMELDMTAFYKPGTTPVFALEADYIDTTLNDYLRKLIAAYSTMAVTMDTPCGYACSDHASWYNKGYPSSFPFEAVTGNDNPTIHGTGDTTSVSGFSWTHSLEFAKIALAFAYELGMP